MVIVNFVISGESRAVVGCFDIDCLIKDKKKIIPESQINFFTALDWDKLIPNVIIIIFI